MSRHIAENVATSAPLINGTYFDCQGIAAPAVSNAGEGRIYFDSSSNKFKVSENGGAYVDLVTGSFTPVYGGFFRFSFAESYNLSVGSYWVLRSASFSSLPSSGVTVGREAATGKIWLRFDVAGKFLVACRVSAEMNTDRRYWVGLSKPWPAVPGDSSVNFEPSGYSVVNGFGGADETFGSASTIMNVTSAGMYTAIMVKNDDTANLIFNTRAFTLHVTKISD